MRKMLSPGDEEGGGERIIKASSEWAQTWTVLMDTH